jgi:hypothetical protein
MMGLHHKYAEIISSSIAYSSSNGIEDSVVIQAFFIVLDLLEGILRFSAEHKLGELKLN